MPKYWKEAASVIIAAKISFPKDETAFPAYRVNIPIKNAENTAKIISEKLRVPNFKVLALRRSSKNCYMPDSYVFPGGNVNDADSSKEWLDLFAHHGVGTFLFKPATPITRKDSKISIFKSQRKDEILRSISLRITGIRETFEESGILLCKNKHAHSFSEPSIWASYLSGYEINKWQEKVQENGNEFINLCRHFECYPDIWSLQEWSNWLTPNDLTKRFNTIFFLVALDQMPTAFSNSSEITELKVYTHFPTGLNKNGMLMFDVIKRVILSFITWVGRREW
jgi:nucleoside diphosphate-linked moiety X motif protein 19